MSTFARGRPPGRFPRSRTTTSAVAWALLLAAVLLVAACGSSAPSVAPSSSAGPAPSVTPGAPATTAPSAPPTTAPSAPPDTPAPSGDAAAVYRAIEDQVIAKRGLPAKERLEPTILSEAEAKARLVASFRKRMPPDKLAVAEGTLKALGLLPADASLEALYADLMGSQVLGFYDTKVKQLFVVSRSGRIGGTEKATFAHEFTHALQDQAFGLQAINDAGVGQGDRGLAQRAFVEGDAVLAMTQWLSGHLTGAELGELLKIDPEAQAQVERMPAILRDPLVLQYQQGFLLVDGIWARGGWGAVDRAYARLPDSTEQVLHPEKYEAGEKPVTVPLDGAALAKAMGAGWSGTPEDTLGEFQLSIWLRENGVESAAAGKAAKGWGGDRFAYLRGPNGAYALALLTAWDSQSDADQFLAAAKTAAANLPGAADARVVPTLGVDRLADHVAVLVASDEATLARLSKAALAGRP